MDEQVDISVDEQADQAVDFTRGLVEAFGAKAEVASHLEDEDTVLVDVTGDNLGLSGPRSDALRSKSSCAPPCSGKPGVMASASTSTWPVTAQRRKRSSSQHRERVRDEDAEQALEPMSASDRKVARRFAEMGVTTTSEGEEPRRRVVIRPA